MKPVAIDRPNKKTLVMTGWRIFAETIKSTLHGSFARSPIFDVRPSPTPVYCLTTAGNRIVGIDFGTTNSSVAYADEQGVSLVRFPAASGRSASSRSLLYLQQQTGPATAQKVSVWTGGTAVAAYLSAYDSGESVRGRLVQSLKSYLSARDLTSTEIFGRPHRFEDLVSRMLLDLRQRASEELGFEVTRALVGRPVVFVGAETEADNDFAVGRLHGAFLQAGFTDVSFAMEPVAAAYAYTGNLHAEETVLIGDFGGGTTDFALLRVGPAVQQRGSRQVIASTGVGLAGDSFDARIVRRLVSPALGSESSARSVGKVLPALPAWVYARLERWHTLSFLRTHSVREMLRTTEKRALEPEKIAALRAVVEQDLGYQMHSAVQRLKAELTANEVATFRFETDVVTLKAEVSRAEFEGWIEPDLDRMRQALDDLLRKSGTDAATVDRVFLTGGTSLVPAVRRLFTERFGEGRVTSGDAFTSVAYGLALMANAKGSR